MIRFFSPGTRKAIALFCFGILLAFQLSDSHTLNKVIGQDRKNVATKTPPRGADLPGAKGFMKGRRLLIDYGLPFEPNELLDSQAKSRVLTKLGALPEFAMAKRLGDSVEGVQVADTLYLPEKVRLTGDTVFIARSIIFEGKNVEVKGNFDLHMFPFDRTALLGTTLDQAVLKAHLPFRKVADRGPMNLNYSTLKLPLADKGRITIDLHGPGYKDWLENQKNKVKVKDDRKSEAKYVFANYVYEPMPAVFAQNHGTTGAQGVDGGQGPGGVGGTSGNTGTAGTCNSSSTIHGGTGTASSVGLAPTAAGGTGGKGDDGTPGGNYTTTINDGDNGTYVFETYGGGGGRGGIGGTGGQGGTGGTGGTGGPGASCDCKIGLGNGGAGSAGSNGGPGGTGGTGGKGGNGKNAGDITISVPYDYVVETHVTFHAEAGPAGEAGLPGTQGLGGFPGDGGRGGDEGTNISCSPSGGNHGPDANGGQSGPLGAWGAQGEPGTPGAAGNVVVNRRSAPPGGGCRSTDDNCGGCPCGDCVYGCDPPTDPWCHLDSYLECTEVCEIDDYGEPENCEEECNMVYYWTCD